jgi:hypothetical protein
MDATLHMIRHWIGSGLNKLPWLAYVEWVRDLPVRKP